LLAFARKPAPVQVTYLGYPNTTGLSEIDYRFTDEQADPSGGGADVLCSEKLFRLPETAWCYRPRPDAPAVASLPSSSTNRVTFGSFNNRPKINPPIIALWSELLQAVPDSRLLLKSFSHQDRSVCAELAGAFADHGITSDRLTLLRPTDGGREHLEHYHQVDIALDTFPYHGTTTTCEALWMGVPVITMAGATHVSRVGASLLHSVGLDELVASSPQDYLRRAASVASDRGRLAQLRGELRRRMAASVLTDATRFTRNLERAYRTMWASWCADRASHA
jgi:predicted O-linked N-acetylglucosamine transferase (SPINDLY family)